MVMEGWYRKLSCRGVDDDAQRGRRTTRGDKQDDDELHTQES